MATVLSSRFASPSRHSELKDLLHTWKLSFFCGCVRVSLFHLYLSPSVFSPLFFPPALELQLLCPGAYLHFVIFIAEPLWSLDLQTKFSLPCYLFAQSSEILLSSSSSLHTVTKIPSILITTKVVPLDITVAKISAVIDLIYYLLPFNLVLVLEWQ